MSNINLSEIKEYNNRVTKLQKDVSQIMAEKKIHTKELEALCSELSEELGRPITPDNIEQIYQELSQKIEVTIKSGTEILDRVSRELGTVPPTQAFASQPGQAGQAGMQGVTGVQGMQRPDDTEGIGANNTLGAGLIDFSKLDI